jgi:hypothetical protein
MCNMMHDNVEQLNTKVLENVEWWNVFQVDALSLKLRRISFIYLCSSKQMIRISSVTRNHWHSVTWWDGLTANHGCYRRLFLCFLCFILNRNSQCWKRVLLWYWKMKGKGGGTKKSRTSRSCCGEKTMSCYTKIIKRWWTSLEVGFCTCL